MSISYNLGQLQEFYKSKIKFYASFRCYDTAVVVVYETTFNERNLDLKTIHSNVSINYNFINPLKVCNDV